MLINSKRNLTIAGFALVLVLFASIRAGQPVVWETNSRAELLKGDSRGVSITDTGVIMLAPKLTEIFHTQQTYIWSSAIDSQGTVFLGTGHDGKVFKVSPTGGASLLYDSSEL